MGHGVTGATCHPSPGCAHVGGLFPVGERFNLLCALGLEGLGRILILSGSGRLIHSRDEGPAIPYGTAKADAVALTSMDLAPSAAARKPYAQLSSN